MIQPLNLNAEVQPVGKPGKKLPTKKIAIFLGIIALGALTGYGLFNLKGGGPKKLLTEVSGTAAVGESYGVEDTKVFTDSAEGKLTSGGIDGEGSHHLIREGGESQNVYLTSSIIDLDQFIGRQVKVWGQTFDAQKAGWLMDVGRLEIIK
ncbi:MAG: hypothetical protein Q8P47_02540 [Candidatus Beckwithbacteria bacterium]|nr:hypothetical protein [Candidatus Beckwithbacteria bacterium]